MMESRIKRKRASIAEEATASLAPANAIAPTVSRTGLSNSLIVEAQAAQERELTRKAKTEMTERLASKDTEIANLRKELDEMCRKRQVR